jgi:ribosome biogenesis protein Tsr3|tara:strand:+ start:461 stop:712 length:252 start_codon:yes stop_codon:yes gene_type:complete
MNLHRVKAVKVVRKGNDWTSILITRQENTSISEEDTKSIATMLSLQEIDVIRVLDMIRGLGTFEEEISLFPEHNVPIKWEFEG